MLTIFTIPKPFKGHIEIIQRNAIQSWRRLHPDIEIILCGDDPGTGEITAEFNLKWVPNLDRNKYGTPLLSSAFNLIKGLARHRLLCYVNCDIILLSDFIKAVQRIQFQRFLMVGQRWNVDITDSWNFEREDWEGKLRKFAHERGEIFTVYGIDYFCFPRNILETKFPPFAVGRPGWDNWFIFQARKLKIPVVDATRVAMVIHQNHDYKHVPFRTGELWRGPEADKHYELMGETKNLFSINDSTYIMTSGGLIPAFEYDYLSSRMRNLPALFPQLEIPVNILRTINHYFHKRLGKISRNQ